MRWRSRAAERDERAESDAPVIDWPLIGWGSPQRLPRVVSGVLMLGWLLAVLGGAGCASLRVSDLDAFETIPMNRVVPYPDAKELRKRAYEIIVVDRASAGIDENSLLEPRRWSRRQLEGMTAEAGATVIDRSLQDLSAIRTEGLLSELDGDPSVLSGADYALATRFSTYRYTVNWKPPFKFLWQSTEEVSDKPGSCLHLAEVEFDVQLIEIGSNDRVSKSFSLEHFAERKTRSLDESCPLSPAAMSVLFETAMDEAMSCLELPLRRLLSPRGHVSAHRKAPEAERHLFRISLGGVQGIEIGDEVEIRREQHATSPSGAHSRTERVIATGIATNQVTAEEAWVEVDLSKGTETILDGDVVRPVTRQGLLSSLSGPSCKNILAEH